MILKFLKQLFCFPHHYEQELSPFDDEWWEECRRCEKSRKVNKVEEKYMKYTTKQSRIEEIIVDLEDGCIIKITRSNLIQTNICPNHLGTEKTYNVSVGLDNGIVLNLKNVDQDFVNSLSQVFPR